MLTVAPSTTSAPVTHSALALATTRRSSSPVVHSFPLAGHPPSVPLYDEWYAIETLKFHELFAVWIDSTKSGELSNSGSRISHIPFKASWWVTTCHVFSSLSVVTYNCYANPVLNSHVTVNCKRTVTIRFNIASSWRCWRNSCFQVTTGTEDDLNMRCSAHRSENILHCTHVY